MEGDLLAQELDRVRGELVQLHSQVSSTLRRLDEVLSGVDRPGHERPHTVLQAPTGAELDNWIREVRETLQVAGMDEERMLLLASLSASLSLLTSAASSSANLTLKSKCPQCSGHLLLAVNEQDREIYLTCFDKPQPTCKNLYWKLTTY